MSSSDVVQVVWSGIQKQLRKSGGSFVYVAVTLDGVDGCPPEVLTEVAQAVDLANAAMVKAGEELAAGFDPLASPVGPIIKIDWPGDTENDTRAWLAQLATILGDVGRTGHIRAAPYRDLPRAIGDNVEPHPAAFLGYTLTDPHPRPFSMEWLLEDTLTEDICASAADWVAAAGGDYYFSEDTFRMKVSASDMAPLLRSAIARSWRTQAISVTLNPAEAHSALLAKEGVVTFDIISTPRQHRDNVSRLRHQLLRQPAALDIGIIRTTRSFTLDWGALLKSPRQPPFIAHAYDWKRNRHLWSRFVPDAHAIQVLTRDHLNKANDLSGWSITSLDGNRYLVEAPDLDAWHATGDVDDATLDQARHDFGAMILTTADIEANRPA